MFWRCESLLHERLVSYWPVMLSVIFGLGIAFLAIPLTLRICHRPAFRRREYDLHHHHSTRVPRFGGLALAAAFICLELFVRFCYPEYASHTPGRWAVFLGALAMFGIGFWD